MAHAYGRAPIQYTVFGPFVVCCLRNKLVCGFCEFNVQIISVWRVEMLLCDASSLFRKTRVFRIFVACKWIVMTQPIDNQPGITERNISSGKKSQRPEDCSVFYAGFVWSLCTSLSSDSLCLVDSRGWCLWWKGELKANRESKPQKGRLRIMTRAWVSNNFIYSFRPGYLDDVRLSVGVYYERNIEKCV